MKKILFVAGLALVGFSAAFAQDLKADPKIQTQSAKQSRESSTGMNTVDPAMIAQRKTERLNRELSFTQEQKQKVQAVFLKEAQENNGRASHNPETEKQLKAIFTAEQNQKYEDMKTKRQQAMTEGHNPARSAELKAAPAVK